MTPNALTVALFPNLSLAYNTMDADALFNRSVNTSEEELEELKTHKNALSNSLSQRPHNKNPSVSPTIQPAEPVPQSTHTGFIAPTTFVVLLSIVTGLYSLSSLAAFMYQKNVLRLSPALIQLLSGILSIPWGFKFIFGYSYDLMIPSIKKSKNLILFVSLVRLFCFIAIYGLELNTALFFLALLALTLCGLYENIVAECALVIMTKKENERNPNEKANHLPIFFGCRAAGQLVGGFFGGRLITWLSIKGVFLVTALLPIVMILICLFYGELENEPRPQRSLIHEWEVIRGLMCQDRVIPMLIFVCLLNATPNFDSLTTFYQTDILKFTMDDLANLTSFSSICYICGLIIYSLYLRKVNPRSFFLSTNFILWLINVSFMLVVLGYVAKWGWSVMVFCMLNFGSYSLVAEMNFMPVIAIWCSICPPNLEATSITLLTALVNFSSNMGVYFGAFLMWILNIQEHNMDKFWILLTIQNIYLIVATVCVVCVPFPDPSKSTPTNAALVPISNKNYDIEFYYND